jgi:hypothetical protein
MATKEAKLEVVSSTNEKQEKRKSLAEFLEKKLNAKREEVAVKRYPVSGGLTTAKALNQFIKNDAQWKFTESLGILESARVLDEQVKVLSGKEATESQLSLTAITIEAIYYFLTKEEGKGFSKAASYVNNLLRPISEALNVSKADREEINQMERDLGTLQDAVLNRVGFEGEDELLTEIEKEISEEISKN